MNDVRNDDHLELFILCCKVPRWTLLCVDQFASPVPKTTTEKGPLHLTSFIGVCGKNHWSVKMATGRLFIHKDRLARQLVSCPHGHKPRRGTYNPHKHRGASLSERGSGSMQVTGNHHILYLSLTCHSVLLSLLLLFLLLRGRLALPPAGCHGRVATSGITASLADE